MKNIIHFILLLSLHTLCFCAEGEVFHTEREPVAKEEAAGKEAEAAKAAKEAAERREEAQRQMKAFDAAHAGQNAPSTNTVLPATRGVDSSSSKKPASTADGGVTGLMSLDDAMDNVLGERQKDVSVAEGAKQKREDDLQKARAESAANASKSGEGSAAPAQEKTSDQKSLDTLKKVGIVLGKHAEIAWTHVMDFFSGSSGSHLKIAQLHQDLAELNNSLGFEQLAQDNTNASKFYIDKQTIQTLQTMVDQPAETMETMAKSLKDNVGRVTARQSEALRKEYEARFSAVDSLVQIIKTRETGLKESSSLDALSGEEIKKALETKVDALEEMLGLKSDVQWQSFKKQLLDTASKMEVKEKTAEVPEESPTSKEEEGVAAPEKTESTKESSAQATQEKTFAQKSWEAFSNALEVSGKVGSALSKHLEIAWTHVFDGGNHLKFAQLHKDLAEINSSLGLDTFAQDNVSASKYYLNKSTRELLKNMVGKTTGEMEIMFKEHIKSEHGTIDFSKKTKHDKEIMEDYQETITAIETSLSYIKSGRVLDKDFLGMDSSSTSGATKDKTINIYNQIQRGLVHESGPEDGESSDEYGAKFDDSESEGDSEFYRDPVTGQLADGPASDDSYYDYYEPRIS